MLVSENTIKARDLRQEFQFLRGATVSAFAHCEYMIGDFLYAVQDFEQLEGEFSYRVENRLKEFRRVFERNEKLAKYHEYANLLIDDFEKAIPDRNDFVHGLARLDVGKREVKIRRIQPSKDGSSRHVIATYKLANLEEKIRVFDDITRHIIELILNVDLEFELGLSSDEIYGASKVWITSKLQ